MEEQFLTLYPDYAYRETSFHRGFSGCAPGTEDRSGDWGTGVRNPHLLDVSRNVRHEPARDPFANGGFDQERRWATNLGCRDHDETRDNPDLGDDAQWQCDGPSWAASAPGG